jgi:hypothetical protein
MIESVMAVQDPLRGHTLAECSREFGVSSSRCAQLANLAVQFLRSLLFIRRSTVPKHDSYDPRQRFQHREFWLKQIDKAKEHPRVRLPVRRFDPTVEHSIATDLGRPYGLRGWDVIAIVRKFEADLLAMAETTGRARKPPKAKVSKSISTIPNDGGYDDAHARTRNRVSLREISHAGQKVHARSRRVGRRP